MFSVEVGRISTATATATAYDGEYAEEIEAHIEAADPFISGRYKPTARRLAC